MAAPRLRRPPPRASGDEPPSCSGLRRAAASAPRARGAGMEPPHLRRPDASRGPPRARGDGPGGNRSRLVTLRSAPRARGWSHEPCGGVRCARVRPARAGMVLGLYGLTADHERLPRVCGDGPSTGSRTHREVPQSAESHPRNEHRTGRLDRAQAGAAHHAADRRQRVRKDIAARQRVAHADRALARRGQPGAAHRVRRVRAAGRRAGANRHRHRRRRRSRRHAHGAMAPERNTSTSPASVCGRWRRSRVG